MSNLDNFHPFRSSVNLKASDTGVAQGVSQAASDVKIDDKDEKDYRPWLSWKTKFLLLIVSLGAGFVFFIASSIYNYLNPLLVPFGGHNKPSPRTEQTSSAPDLAFDKNDLDERGREVNFARKKAGFFASMFCKGGRKSTFCE